MPKSIYILFLLCALGAKADAQSLSQNYVLGKQMLDTEGTRAITSVTYYDGLGYPVETATNGLGGTGKYAYTLLEYDLPGRTKREWLAGAIGSDCSFVPSSELSSSLTAYHKDQNPYTVKESDVLDREASILGPGEHLCSAYYHDIRGLVVKSRQTKLGDILLSQDVTYSFTKKPLVITSTIQRGKVSKSVIQTNTYNRYNDQLATVSLQAGGSERVVASYAYDDVGKLVNIGRRGNAGNILKKYNVRGWLQSIKTPRFSESLSYETQAAHPRYDGNVSRLQWQSGKDNILRGYDFEYDDLNRLTDSYYAEGTGMSQNKDHYSEKGIEYSSNGCIEKMQRYGRKNDNTFGLIDDLSYLYNGNQVKSISDKAGSLVYNGSFDFKDGASASTEYSYNVNGAIVKDLNKGINGIEYDVLGNLNSITFGNGFKTKYVYDAIGNKLQTTHVGAVTSITDYCGNFVFEDGKLVKYLFDGGYCSFDVNLNPTYHYYEKDHLGSVRMVVNENGTIEQVNHYYPFGGLYGDLSYNSESQRNKYIGKEFDHTFGLDLYDHGARMYDAARGGWDRMEPLYGKYYSYSPYAYCGNAPLLLADLDGKDWYRENGLYLYSPYITSKTILKKGQAYIGTDFYDYNTGTSYRSDGSIVFSKEKLAYQRLRKLSRVKNALLPAGREESAYLLSNKKVLVMPDYKNSSTESKSYGYILKGNHLISPKKEVLTIVGHVHTHQDMMFDKGFSRKDWNLAVEHVNLPYFIIHADGGIYGGVNKNGKMKSWENYPMADFEDIKNGTLSLFSLVQELLK